MVFGLFRLPREKLQVPSSVRTLWPQEILNGETERKGKRKQSGRREKEKKNTETEREGERKTERKKREERESEKKDRGTERQREKRERP